LTKNKLTLEMIASIFGSLLIAEKQDFINQQQQHQQQQQQQQQQQPPNLERLKHGKPEIANKLLLFLIENYKLIFCYEGM
jgi:hypothetical protein